MTPGQWPAYFTRLAPFRDLFQQGTAILTYHKFGPRPRRARLRGLYLGGRLLDRQLSELRAAGFAPVRVDQALEEAPGRRVGLTIDDGFRSVREIALPILLRHGATATLYLVADRLGQSNDWEVAQGELQAPLMTESEVREWLAAGQAIGAHSLSHPWLTRIPVAQAREEIGASRRRLEDRFGVPVTDFCYPYGDWNSVVRGLVEEAGYRTATTTEFGVNAAGTDRLGLRRVTARHASWSWRAVKAWWRRYATGSSPSSASQRG